MTANSFIVVLEEHLIEISKLLTPEELAEGGTLKILDAGRQFKAAELTPVYMVNINTGEIYVYAKEYYGKKLH